MTMEALVQRREFLTSALAAPLVAPSRPKPNIVFILADDLGIGDVACYGGKFIQTPNIDALAAEGLRFTNAYAGAPVCAPSRNALMTGQHTGHTSIRTNHSIATGERVPLKASDITVGHVLKEAGYSTGVFGKWGMGEPDTTGVPNKMGFDDWFGFLNQDHAVEYYTDYLWRNQQRETLQGNLNGGRREYVQDLFTREAVRFIDTHKNRPFFLYLAYTNPHENHEVPDIAPYSDRPWPENHKIYAAMVTRMDRDIGRIMALLKRHGIDENTLVIFSSDNGSTGKKPIEALRGTLDFRDAKGSVYEGGIRVPAIARWPGKVPAGATSDFAWAFWDFLPTAAEVAGARSPRSIDGISILPTLRGKTQRPHDYLYWEAFGRGSRFRQGIRMGEWKGIRDGLKSKLELYNLAKDPGEKSDVAAAHPEVVAKITGTLATARTDNPDYPTERDAVKPKGARNK